MTYSVAITPTLFFEAGSMRGPFFSIGVFSVADTSAQHLAEDERG